MNVEVSHRELVDVVARRLREAGVASPWADARWLVAHVVASGADPAAGGAADLEHLVVRRVAREPLQLVLGTTAFRTIHLACEAGVFIPRPETEVVAGAAIEAARSAPGAPRVVDVCTGTGAIACALLAEVAGARIIATDLEPAAARLAERNLARVMDGVAGARPAPGASATVVTGDLLEAVDTAWRGHLDVLVANPPYLPARERGGLAPEVSGHDPAGALVGGPDGHEFVDELLCRAPTWLRPGGTVVVEIDERRGSEARHRAEGAGLHDVRVLPDLTGADRAVVGRRAG